MAVAIITAYPPTQPGARADLYAGRDNDIRGLFGLRGPRPGDSDYVDTSMTVAPVRTTTAAGTVNDPVLAPESNAMKYVGWGLLAAAVVGIYFWTR